MRGKRLTERRSTVGWRESHGAWNISMGWGSSTMISTRATSCSKATPLLLSILTPLGLVAMIWAWLNARMGGMMGRLRWLCRWMTSLRCWKYSHGFWGRLTSFNFEFQILNLFAKCSLIALLQVVLRFRELKVNNWMIFSIDMQVTALHYPVCYMPAVSDNHIWNWILHTWYLVLIQARPCIFIVAHAIDPMLVETGWVASSHFDTFDQLDSPGSECTILPAAQFVKLQRETEGLKGYNQNLGWAECAVTLTNEPSIGDHLGVVQCQGWSTSSS